MVGVQPDVGDGRAIVACGDPDLAAHVRTLVAGTYGKMAGMDGDIVRSDRMRRAAQEDTRGALAGLTWMGTYDAPQSIPGEARQMSLAEGAAPLLSSFQTGLRATPTDSTPGVDPTEHGFGAKTSAPDPDEGHGDHWDQANQAGVQEMGRVIAGRAATTLVATLLAVVVLCAGCGPGHRDEEDPAGPGDKPSVSALPFAQARQMAREEAQKVLASLPDGARLEPADGDPRGSTGYCVDRSNPPKGTPVNWQGNWDVVGVPLDPQLITTVADALEKRGWRRAYGSVEDGQVSYEDDRGFNMVFTVSDVRVSLTEGTPCVKPADLDNPLDT